MKILLVEGNNSSAGSLRETVEKWGHQVEKENRGKSALERVKEKNFDLLLLDLDLPDSAGPDLIPKFKELRPELGIITMTEQNSRELELRAREQGIFYYMLGPYERKNLKLLLDHIAGKRQEKNLQRKGGINVWQK